MAYWVCPPKNENNQQNILMLIGVIKTVAYNLNGESTKITVFAPVTPRLESLRLPINWDRLTMPKRTG